MTCGGFDVASVSYLVFRAGTNDAATCNDAVPFDTGDDVVCFCAWQLQGTGDGGSPCPRSRVAARPLLEEGHMCSRPGRTA